MLTCWPEMTFTVLTVPHSVTAVGWAVGASVAATGASVVEAISVGEAVVGRGDGKAVVGLGVAIEVVGAKVNRVVGAKVRSDVGTSVNATGIAVAGASAGVPVESEVGGGGGGDDGATGDGSGNPSSPLQMGFPSAAHVSPAISRAQKPTGSESQPNTPL